MKSGRTQVEITALYEELGSYRAVGALMGCDHKTLKRYVEAAGDAGQLASALVRSRVTDDFAGLICERVEQTHGRVTARRLMRIVRVAGYAGSERSLRRAVADAKVAWRARQALEGRVYRPWVSEPGEWMLCDWGAAGAVPTPAGARKLSFFSAVLGWSRFRTVSFCCGERFGALAVGLAHSFEQVGGVPGRVLFDNPISRPTPSRWPADQTLELKVRDCVRGAKALRRAIKDVFGEHALVHRCHRHKERNVTDLLPERDRDQVRARMRAAWALTDAELAEQRLQLLAGELDQTWPDAAGSLREGLHDTLTLMRLGIDGQLAKTLCSTNPCESMIEIVRYTQRNVKRWHDGDMRKRWTAAGMLVAEQQFRRIIGYRDLAKLVIAIERHAILAAQPNPDRVRVTEPITV